MMPAWALLSRVWLDGFDRTCHGRMGWVVAVCDWIALGTSSRSVRQLLQWHPHSRRLMRRVGET